MNVTRYTQSGRTHRNGTLARSRQSSFVTPISKMTAQAGKRIHSATCPVVGRRTSISGESARSPPRPAARAASAAQARTDAAVKANAADQKDPVVESETAGSSRKG